MAGTYRGGAPALLGQRCTDARPACTAVVEIGYPEGGLAAAARELVARLRATPVRYGVLLPTDPRVSRAERVVGGHGCRWCRNPWVYAGGGVAVAALTTLVVVLVRDSRSPVIVIDPDDFRR